ncbi:hypothetical protein G6F29_012823 [Rhizopus arrhizus]|nr:hypothetical protein G6F29_012823 [Rhizopus arrhizus]KAG1394890.1 hypothetical protein G6F58_012045 [Rhizopus delemar]KAG1098637.1 hypothetical protein G6F39_005247 [Rhizopus arrhizus]KAG1277583.1 hypothetical protein G6F65_008454 [Rhizopus arrhizus]KAG1324318.1 hypothetical protein G6F63_012640 [Rhizopus arrhizus]
MTNNNDGELSNKKQKFDHVNDESSTWNINDQEDIWEAIRQHLKASISHDFCLESYHIIKCGYSIKCNPSIPTELLDHVQVENYTISTPFQTHSKYTTDVLKVMKTNDVNYIEEVVKSLKVSENNSANFVKGFFKVCLWIYKKPKLYERLALSEIAFNHSFIWQIMEFVVDTVETPLTFYPAEYVLKAAQEETKVDACILDGDNELAVLETSGKILLNDNAKYGLDHIKVHYGALSIFNAIFKKYCTATEETATKLKIPFIHARHDTIHLWVFELCSTGLYCSKKVYKSKVPEDMAASKDILTLANFCWCFREALLDAVQVTRRMKEEHEEYQVQKMLLGEGDSRVSLSTLLKLDICKPVMCAGYPFLIPEEKEEEEAVVRYTKL